MSILALALFFVPHWGNNAHFGTTHRNLRVPQHFFAELLGTLCIRNRFDGLEFWSDSLSLGKSEKFRYSLGHEEVFRASFSRAATGGITFLHECIAV